jgi:hypothetical protein
MRNDDLHNYVSQDAEGNYILVAWSEIEGTNGDWGVSVFRLSIKDAIRSQKSGTPFVPRSQCSKEALRQQDAAL